VGLYYWYYADSTHAPAQGLDCLLGAFCARMHYPARQDQSVTGFLSNHTSTKLPGALPAALQVFVIVRPVSWDSAPADKGHRRERVGAFPRTIMSPIVMQGATYLLRRHAGFAATWAGIGCSKWFPSASTVIPVNTMQGPPCEHRRACTRRQEAMSAPQSPHRILSCPGPCSPPTVLSIGIGDDPRAWQRAGFCVGADGVVQVGQITIQLTGSSGEAAG